MAERRAHILFVPLAYVGHIQPFVQLLYHLDARHPGTIVTVVGTLSVTSDLVALQDRGDFKSIDLRLHDEPAWTPPRHENYPLFPYRAGTLSASLRKEVQGLWKELVAGINEPEAVTAIVSDMFFDWCKDLADEISVPWYSYFSTSAVTTLLILEAPKFHKASIASQHPLDDTKSLRELIPDLVDFVGSGHILHGDLATEHLENPEYFIRLRDRTTHASGLLLNTTEELEEQFGALAALRNLMKTSKVFTIGPSLQLPGFGRVYTTEDPAVDCLSWLDTQKDRSVLYISFGSIVSMQRDQVVEIAAGLEKSGVPFLWALKVGSGELSDVLPAEFEERTAGWGRIESGWVPQGKILGHPATGGCFTHCGWNTIMESICNGVPCIGWPISADQPPNARFLQEAKIGITVSSFKMESSDSFQNSTRREVEMAIKSLMLGEDGRRARSNIADLQKSVKAAVATGGSSYRCLHEVLDAITQTS